MCLEHQVAGDKCCWRQDQGYLMPEVPTLCFWDGKLVKILSRVMINLDMVIRVPQISETSWGRTCGNASCGITQPGETPEFMTQIDFLGICSLSGSFVLATITHLPTASFSTLLLFLHSSSQANVVSFFPFQISSTFSKLFLANWGLS